MIQQGNRKFFTAEEKNTFLQMFKEQDSKDFARFAQKCEVPIPQFRLWLQQSESGVELKDSKPLPVPQRKGNGRTDLQKANAARLAIDEVRDYQAERNQHHKPRKAKKAEHPASDESYYADQLTKTYWAQQLLRARVGGRDKVAALHEVFQKATGFTGHAMTNWTRDYVATPKGKKFERGIQPPKPVKAKKVMPGRPAHTRYLNPETGKHEFKIMPEYWNKLVTLIGALDMDLRSLDQKLTSQTKRLDELLELWR